MEALCVKEICSCKDVTLWNYYGRPKMYPFASVMRFGDDTRLYTRLYHSRLFKQVKIHLVI